MTGLDDLKDDYQERREKRDDEKRIRRLEWDAKTRMTEHLRKVVEAGAKVDAARQAQWEAEGRTRDERKARERDRKEQERIERLLESGSGHMNAERYKEAIRCFDECIIAFPDDSYLLDRRAMAKHWLKQYDQAVLDHDRAVLADPEVARYRITRALTHYCRGSYSLAESDATAALEREHEREQTPWFHAVRGQCRQKLEEHEAAVADFTAAINMYSEPGPGLYRDRAGSLAKLGRKQEARQDLAEAKQLDARTSS